jgi:hypothetical protein
MQAQSVGGAIPSLATTFSSNSTRTQPETKERKGIFFASIHSRESLRHHHSDQLALRFPFSLGGRLRVHRSETPTGVKLEQAQRLKNLET